VQEFKSVISLLLSNEELLVKQKPESATVTCFIVPVQYARYSNSFGVCMFVLVKQVWFWDVSLLFR